MEENYHKSINDSRKKSPPPETTSSSQDGLEMESHSNCINMNDLHSLHSKESSSEDCNIPITTEDKDSLCIEKFRLSLELQADPQLETQPQTEDDTHSFVRAVNNKFKDNDNNPEDLTELASLYIPKRRPVELTDSGTILLPKHVILSGCNISVCGDKEAMESMCHYVEELDLMANNICSWGEVFDIIEAAPNLTFLNLSQNQIPSLPFPDDLDSRTLPKLRGLVLNDTKVSWKVLMRLLEVFPQIEELHLSVNGYTSFDLSCSDSSLYPSSSSTSSSTTDIQPYCSLRHLYFVANQITDWSEINRIGAFFPNLESLLLSETDIMQLSNGGNNIARSFPQLKKLGLNRTNLKSWTEVEKLRLFPELKDVRLRFIPFLENQRKEIQRNHTIALLPAVTQLNQTPVTESEREDAERAYIRLYMDEENRPPRCDELEKKHGKLDHLCPVSLKPKTTVKIFIKVEELEDGDKIKELQTGEEMEVELKTTMQEMRKYLSNVAHHPANKIRLFHTDRQSGSNWTERMLYPTRNLLGYHIEDGDEIIALKMP